MVEARIRLYVPKASIPNEWIKIGVEIREAIIR
jgi:hypothetical protein